MGSGSSHTVRWNTSDLKWEPVKRNEATADIGDTRLGCRSHSTGDIVILKHKLRRLSTGAARSGMTRTRPNWEDGPRHTFDSADCIRGGEFMIHHTGTGSNDSTA